MMQLDFSWEHSVQQYLDLYASLLPLPTPEEAGEKDEKLHDE
jgi:hypothetical protein